MGGFPIAPHTPFGQMLVKKNVEENLINGTAYDYLDAEG